MTNGTGYWVRQAPEDLAWHWDGAYLFRSYAIDWWAATRVGNGRTLIAGDPAAPRRLVRLDYGAQPVTRDEGSTGL